MELNYQHDVQIDPNGLDLAWLNQAKLAIDYGNYYAKCLAAERQAEQNVKLVRSELQSAALADPSLCSGGKATAIAVEAYYRTHPRHVAAKEEYLRTHAELVTAEIAKREIAVSRKAALQNLVTLHGQQYFASPSIPRDLTRTEVEQQVGVETNRRMARRTRRTK